MTFTPDAVTEGTFANTTTAKPVIAKTKDGYLICEYFPINTDIDIEPYYEYEYTVRYLELGTNTPLASEKVELKEANKSVTERAITIGGYRAIEPTEQIFMLDSDGKVITFYYKKLTSYIVRYLEFITDEPLRDDKIVNDLEVGTSVTENAVDIKYYETVLGAEKTITLIDGDNIMSLH